MSLEKAQIYQSAQDVVSSSVTDASSCAKETVVSTETIEELSSRRGYWLFSARIDLLVFLGSALVSLAALWIGWRVGVLNNDAPEWAWVPFVLLIDVAHVYSTGFRVYLDSEELKRKPLLYGLVPLLGYVIGVALYSESNLLFWRVLAYLAVFHFIRQQYGWVMLYRAKAGERDSLGRSVDTFAIYSATIYPLIYWHSQLPRQFWWFLKGDFAPLPSLVEEIARPLYWLALALYFMHALYRWVLQGRVNPGKDIVVATTAVCWYVGIVAFNSDYAFTVTNVIIHGVPYLALVYWYARSRRASASASYRVLSRGPLVFLLTLWAFAYVEELFWDRSLWHERGWLFGGGWDMEGLKMLIVPLLALPQITHYVLDGFIWRRRSNPNFSLV